MIVINAPLTLGDWGRAALSYWLFSINVSKMGIISAYIFVFDPKMACLGRRSLSKLIVVFRLLGLSSFGKSA
jgi:hypothetical protein